MLAGIKDRKIRIFVCQDFWWQYKGSLSERHMITMRDKTILKCVNTGIQDCINRTYGDKQLLKEDLSESFLFFTLLMVFFTG